MNLDKKEYSDAIPCGVEGCPRVNPEWPKDKMCGLAKVYGIKNAPMDPLCATVDIVDKWIAEGLFD